MKTTNSDISAIEEMVVMLILLADGHLIDPRGIDTETGRWSASSSMVDIAVSAGKRKQARDLVEDTIGIACAEGFDPDEMVHPEGIEALSMYMYGVATRTWERSIPPLPVTSGKNLILNVTGARQAWRWRRTLTKVVQRIGKRDYL